MDLDANQTYITTNSVNFSKCPIGVTEGVALSDWNGQLQMNKDTTFLIECHKDEVLGDFFKNPKCSKSLFSYYSKVSNMRGVLMTM